jgi:hypothetical protein
MGFVGTSGSHNLRVNVLSSALIQGHVYFFAKLSEVFLTLLWHVDFLMHSIALTLCHTVNRVFNSIRLFNLSEMILSEVLF